MTADTPDIGMQSPADEHLVLVRHKHWMQFAPPVLIAFLLLIVGVLLVTGGWLLQIDGLAQIMYIAGCTAVICAVHILFHAVLSAYASLLVVTNKRVIHYRQQLFSLDDKEEIPLNLVFSVEARQHGLLQSLLHCGSVWFNKQNHIPFVSRPHWTAGQISQARGMT